MCAYFNSNEFSVRASKVFASTRTLESAVLYTQTEKKAAFFVFLQEYKPSVRKPYNMVTGEKRTTSDNKLTRFSFFAIYVRLVWKKQIYKMQGLLHNFVVLAMSLQRFKESPQKFQTRSLFWELVPASSYHCRRRAQAYIRSTKNWNKIICSTKEASVCD